MCPQLFAYRRQSVGKGGILLVVPSRPPKSSGRLCHPAMREQSDHREQPQQCRCAPPYRHTNKPVEYHTAVSEAISTVRSLSPHQLASVVGFQTVLGSSATAERLGKRSPFMRGLPIWPGLR